MANTAQDIINASMGRSQDPNYDDIQAGMGGSQPGGPVVITLGTLSLSTAITSGTVTNGSINGATSGSSIASNVGGLTVNSGARTFAFDGTASAGTVANGLVESLAGATNSPRSSPVTVAAVVVGVPTMTFANPTAAVTEGDSGTKTVSNTINVDRQGVTGALTINLTYGGTATSGTDYVAGPVSLTLADGVSSGSFDLTINGDTAVEANETIIINAALAGYSATASKTITITNDDLAAPSGVPRVWINTDFTTDNTTDPDDQQLMYAALLFSDVYDLRGIGTNPSGASATSGTTARDQLLSVINGSYATDYPSLAAANSSYPSASTVAARTYAGNGTKMANSTTSRPTDASTALIAEAKAANAAGVPLWVLEWGPRTNLAQALIQDPTIIPMIRVFSIGPRTGYNYTSDSVASDYVNARALNDGLWQIFSDTTFRGFYINSAGSNSAISGWVERYARGYGAMGAEFSQMLQLRPTSPVGLKAGDGSSLFYIIDNVLRGVGNDPTQDGWGGRYVKNTALGANAWSDSQATADRLSSTYPGAKTVYDQRGSTGINGGYLAAWASRFTRLPFAGIKVSLDASTGTVAEGSTLTVTAARATDHVYGNTRPFTVDYALVGSGGSPLSAADFGGTLPAGTLTFAGSSYVDGSNAVAGADLSKTITLTPTSDAATEGTETGTLTLSNFTGGALAGAIISDAISVTDTNTTPPPGGQTTYTGDDFESVTADGNLPGRTASGGGTWVNYRTDRTPLVKVATKDATGISTTGLAYINVSPPTTDYEVEEDVLHVTIGLGAGPIINMSGSQAGGNGTFYSFFYDSTNGWTIGKDANSGASNPPNNTISPAASGVPAPTAGQTKKLKLRRVTSGGVATLTGYVDGVLTHTVTDSSPIASPGFPGSRFISTTRIDNYVARSNPA